MNCQFNYSYSAISSQPPLHNSTKLILVKVKVIYDWRFTTNQFVLASSPLRPTIRDVFQLNPCSHVMQPYFLRLKLFNFSHDEPTYSSHENDRHTSGLDSSSDYASVISLPSIQSPGRLLAIMVSRRQDHMLLP
jgi:hypothetical protein